MEVYMYMATGLFEVVPLLSHCSSTRIQVKSSGVWSENSCGWSGNFILIMELRKHTLTFRDVIDLPPCDGSSPIHELVMGTVEDLHKLYPCAVSHSLSPEIDKITTEQGLGLFYMALKCVRDSWACNHKWIQNVGHDSPESLDNIIGLEQLGGMVVSELKHMTQMAERISDEAVGGSTIGEALTKSYFDNCPSPNTPTSAPPPEPSAFVKPLLSPPRLKVVQIPNPVSTDNTIFSQKLSPLKHGNKDEMVISKPPPPPPPPMTKGSSQPPPPPPPLGAGKALRPKKAATKLKRSSHMGSLYRALKGKVEGSSLRAKQGHGKKSQIGGASNGGKQGMADALAEMTRRSAYFQQIEKDVEKHSKSILEIKAAINSFQTKDMSELVKFHKSVEQHLEKLTDETQVLARFEGFPSKKLESLRTATALYLKLEGILNTLKNWKVAPPLGHLLDKVDSVFDKIKRETDALERSKDEESKRFQSHNITFDFNILVRIKESMVDVSSCCMELALKERKNTNMLWRTFQFAFRVYSFAGGQDERADALTRELALQIQTE